MIEGIPLNDQVVDDLKELAVSFGIEFRDI
jgi:hypothetical protein